MPRFARGSVIVWTVLMLTLLLGFAALAINSGHLTTVKGELQNGVDAAALAGAAQLTGTVDQITPDGASSTTAAVRTLASYHYTDRPGATDVVPDLITLGEWRPAARPGCEAGDVLTAYQDSAGAHFCEVRARDAGGAFRINAVYARAQRAAGVAGGGAVSMVLGGVLGRSTADQSAEAIAITGGPCESSCLNVPMVVGVGCITGGAGGACAADAPPESAGPQYTFGLSPTPVRSGGWSVFNGSNPSENLVCNFLQAANGGCSSVELGSYIQVDVGQGNKFSGGCKGDAGQKKTCDWYKTLASRPGNPTIEVPVISMSGSLNESCPSTYTGNAWVVGYATFRIMAANCKSGCAGPWCATHTAAGCDQYAASECVLTQIVCNHQGGANSTGCAWTGTSSYHPVLVQSRLPSSGH